MALIVRLESYGAMPGCGRGSPPVGRRFLLLQQALRGLDERVKRRVLQKLRAAHFRPGRRMVGDPTVKLRRQARFADACFADEPDELALAGAGALPAFLKLP